MPAGYIEESDSKTLALSAAVFLAFAFGGFYLASSAGGEKPFVAAMNVTVDPDTDIAIASFDGQKIDLMHEDSTRAVYYLDFDRDGSFDLELEGLTHDGQVREYNRTVTLDRTNYRLYFRYHDDAETDGDSWLTLYRVMEIR